MIKLEVGDVLERYIGRDEEVRFGLSDTGSDMTVVIDTPTSEEVEQFKAKMPFEIRFVYLKNVIMVCVKIGNHEWMDMPYSPHLSSRLSRLTFPNDNQGLNLQLFLIDGKTGTIKSMRLIGLSANFTRDLYAAILEEGQKSFDVDEYEQNINEIYSKYTTKQLLKLCTSYCKIR